MIKASYSEKIVRKVMGLRYCHFESADKQAKQSRTQYYDRQTTGFFICANKFYYNKYILKRRKAKMPKRSSFFILLFLSSLILLSFFPDVCSSPPVT